jgi:TolB-like protein
MTDVFISYAHADRERIEKLARALEVGGLTVWWDRRIDPGAEFAKDIERALAAAKVVIVAWSAAGNDSPWVRDEANFARRKGALIPIRLDANEPPLGFQQFQAFDFSRWRGDAGAEEFATLLSSLRRRIAGETAPFEPAPARPRGVLARLRRRPAPALAAVALGVVVLLSAVFVARGPFGTRSADAPGEASEAQGAEAVAKDARVGLAVLPFTNLSADPEQEYFADGLTEELLNWLGNVEGLKVPGRTSSFQFRGKSEDLRLIGERLSVDYLLEGSVRRSGEALRITAQLIEAKTGYHLWSETYDRKLTDLFAIQAELANRVVTDLLGKIPETGVSNPAAVGDVDPRAHALYLEGRALFSPRQWDKAYEKFRDAVAVDPRHAFAQAYIAILAANYKANASQLPGNPDLDAIAARALAEAVRLKPQAADVLVAQGWVAEAAATQFYGPAPAAATAFYERAVRANPRHVEALHSLARSAKSVEQATELYERVLDIDPAHTSARNNLINLYVALGERAQAISLARQALAMPDSRFSAALAGRKLGDLELTGEALFRDWDATGGDGRWLIASTLLDLSAVDEARFLFARETAKAAQPAWRQMARINIAVLDRDDEASLRAAEEMHRLEEPPIWSSWTLATALIRSGDPQRAYEVLVAQRPDLASGKPQVVGAPAGCDLVDQELLAAAHALQRLGRRDDARTLWKSLLAAYEASGGSAASWGDHLTLALVHANLGDRAAAVREFRAAYDAGFRYLWTYDCFDCVLDGFSSENGLFAELAAIPENAVLIEKIKAENAKTLEQFNKQYGVLDKVRAMMAADAGR